MEQPQPAPTPTAMVALTLPADQVALLSCLVERAGDLLNAMNVGVWLDEEAAAKRFGVGRSTVREWGEYFGMPYSMLGQVKRYHSREVDEWYKLFRKDSKKGLDLANSGAQRRDVAKKISTK